MASRGTLVSTPRSGARPLFGGSSTTSPARSPRPKPRSATGTRATGTRATGSPRPRPRRKPASPAPTLPLPASPAPASTATAPPASPAPASTTAAPPASSPHDYTVEGAGAFLALLIYPLVVNLLNGGPAQMWGWVRAKWINQPYGAYQATGTTQAPGTSTAGGRG